MAGHVPDMVIGIDFDNTIVSYDELFHRLATERGLIPAGLPHQKTAVRDQLRQSGREDVWTELQGDVYGKRMGEAPPFPGVIEFFARAQRAGLPLYIISHKTRHPVIGPPHDLHRVARAWLETHRFFDAQRIGFSPASVFFETTRQDKLKRIAGLGCTHFVDDLEETFREVSFPTNVEKILFSTKTLRTVPPGAKLMTSWREIEAYVFAADR